MYVCPHLTSYTSEALISLLTCTARPTTQPVVSDIRHAKQVPQQATFLCLHMVPYLALYPASSAPLSQRPGDKANDTILVVLLETNFARILLLDNYSTNRIVIINNNLLLMFVSANGRVVHRDFKPLT